jgi:hypothetical protein
MVQAFEKKFGAEVPQTIFIMKFNLGKMILSFSLPYKCLCEALKQSSVSGHFISRKLRAAKKQERLSRDIVYRMYGRKFFFYERTL